MSVQLIDDQARKTLLAVYGKQKKGVNKTDQAKQVGKEAAEAAKAKGIAKVVFDRGGWAYTGRVKALSEALREGGLEF